MSRTLETAMKQIRRSPYQVMTAVLALSLTFFAVSVFALLMMGSSIILKYFEASPQVIAFFERGKDIEDFDKDRIKKELEETGKLASFKYVSAREAEAIYKEKTKEDDPLTQQLVDYKILPPSIEISATEIGALPMLKEILESEPLVKDIDFYEDIVDSLAVWIKNLRFVGLGVVGFLLALSILIITVIVGMKVKSKQMEIEAMRLLGANNWFIQGPFLLEGIFYGFSGAFLGWLSAYISLLYATPFLISWLAEIELLPVNIVTMLILLGLEMIVGVVVGVFASLLAVKRFLKI